MSSGQVPLDDVDGHGPVTHEHPLDSDINVKDKMNMYPSSPRRILVTLACGLVVATAACGSDDSADALPPAACDAYATIGAAMFGDPSGVPDAVATLTSEAPESLEEAATTYGAAFDAMMSGDESALESDEFTAASEELGAAVYDSCESSAHLDVSGIDYGFEGLPESIDAGRVAIEFTNDTTTDEPHELVLMRKVDGVTETAAELLELPEDELMSKIVPAAVVFADDKDGKGVALVDLEPGNYVAVCMIPTNGDGPPHAMNGMIADVVVA